LSDSGWVVLMDAATRDARFADAIERVVSDAVDEAVKTTEAGVDHALAGRAAGRRFRDALASGQKMSVRGDHGGSALRVPTAGAGRVSIRETRRRADAFRRMAGVRV
jgi:hypothetical protein